MNEVMGTDVSNETTTEESGAGKYIAMGVASAMLVLGAGLGYVLGSRRGKQEGFKVGKAEAAAKLEAAVAKVTDDVQAATGTKPEAPAAK